MRALPLILLCTATGSLAQPPLVGTCTVLPADNIWNTPVDTLPVSSQSSTYVTTIGATSPTHADFGSGTWNGGPIGIPWVTVPATQTKYPATFQYADESDPGPYAVPLNAPIEGGSTSTGDRHAIAVDTGNCILYELYSAFPEAASWQAGSGAIFNLKSNALRPATWTSADAAGLPIMVGLARYDEVASGEIRHALRFTVPHTQRAYVWPARHYASSLTDPKYPPMGARFRLKASFDISSFPADVQVILRALQKYGLILADNGSAWYISGAPDDRWNNDHLSTMRNIPGSAYEAVDVSSLMIDPNSGQAMQAVRGVTVMLTPSSALLAPGAGQQFTATVQGSADPAVTWSVNSLIGGSLMLGAIDATGMYTAPPVTPASGGVTVQATSVASPSASASATVTIQNPAPVIAAVTPNPAPAGSLTLTVNGSHFQSGAVVHFAGTPLNTTFVSFSQLLATGSAAAPGTALPLTVTNPDGQASNAYSLTVVNATPPPGRIHRRRTVSGIDAFAARETGLLH